MFIVVILVYTLCFFPLQRLKKLNHNNFDVLKYFSII
jgi:hypothetical protein